MPRFSRDFASCATKTAAIAVGYGSLYNHSYKPNAAYEECDNATMLFRALPKSTVARRSPSTTMAIQPIAVRWGFRWSEGA